MVGALASMLNKPSKVSIAGFKDEKFFLDLGKMDLQVNPDSISHSHTIKYDNDLSDGESEVSKNTGTAAGTANKSLRYKNISPESLSFTFVFDATGTIFKPPGTLPFLINVEEQIEKFKKIAYYYNGDFHSPPYVRLEWGSASAFTSWNGPGFRCKLSKLDINYTMFKPNGTPLRAELSVSFTQFLSESDIKRITNDNSPDMTHVRTVQAGDNLPMMCLSVYGSNDYYLEVARVNGMTSIFNLQPGTQLLFPPLEK